MGDEKDTKDKSPAKKPPAKKGERPPARAPQSTKVNRAIGNKATVDQSAQEIPTPPKRYFYGETELGADGIKIRRDNPQISGHQNLVIIKYTVQEPGKPAKVLKQHFWNTPRGGHSEQEIPGFIDKIEAQHGKKNVNVEKIWSERQFCGPAPGEQDCQGLINKRYPKADKEFVHNYQMPPGTKFTGGENTRNVVADRIEAFRDSGAKIDYSTRNDPPPYETRAQGRIPSQVMNPPQKPGGGTGGTEGGAAPGAQGTQQPTPAPGPANPVSEPPAKPTPETAAKPTAETPSKPTAQTQAKPTAEAPAKPIPKASTTASTDTPAKGMSEPAKPTAEAPAKPTTDTPAKPIPKASTNTATDTPTKGSAAAPAKPASTASPAPKASPAPSKPTAPQPTAAKPAAPEPAPSPIAPKGGLGTAAVKAASNAGTVLLGQAMNQLNKLAAQSQDKDLTEALDALNTAMDIKGALANPTRFVGEKIKSELIQGVFRHFSRKVVEVQQAFEESYPSVATLREDIADTGIGLEAFEKAYGQAANAVRIPGMTKALVYAGLALSIKENTPEAQIEAAIATINRELAALPNVGRFVKNYFVAADAYNFAMLVVSNRVRVRREEYPQRSSAMIDDLKQRAALLDRIGGVFEDYKNRIWDSPAIFLLPFYMLASEMETLAAGFNGLASQLRGFADVIGSRPGEYDRELSRLDAQAKLLADRAVRPF